MTPLVLRNGRVVNEGRIVEVDVTISSGRIERLGGGRAPARAEVVDLGGAYVLPGLIDDQVHCREPGLTHKATLGTESAAALAGGVTSFLDMPNTSPQTTTREALADKHGIAARTCHTNFAFYLGATNSNIDEIRRVTPQEACGIKVFMGASTGDMLVDDEAALEAIFADAPLLVATHCESSPMIRVAERQARERFGEDVPMAEHPRIRSAEACYASSSTAVELARRHGTRLHVLHLTTARELELFTPGPIEAKRITAEACVHHLWFDESRYADLGTLIKCNPAIKTARDREALIGAVAEDVIDVIATDHAPHTRAEKQRSYFEAPAGLPLVQHSLLMLLEMHAAGRLSLPAIVDKTAHNPARLFGIKDRGFVREGYHADLAVVDPARVTEVTAAQLLYKCGWSPLEGVRLHAAVTMTVQGGRIACRDGRVVGGPSGRPLELEPR